MDPLNITAIAMADRTICRNLVTQLDSIREILTQAATENDEVLAKYPERFAVAPHYHRDLVEVFRDIERARSSIVNIHDGLTVVIPTERLR